MPSLTGSEPYVSGDTLYVTNVSTTGITSTDIIEAQTGIFSDSMDATTANIYNLNVDTNLLCSDQVNNRIGINTATPGYPLDVIGNVNINNGSSYKINGTNVLSGSTLGSGVTSSSLTSVGTLSSLTVTGDVTIDSNTLKVDSVGNKVGILNTSPAYPLDVNGNVNVTGIINMASYLRTTYGSTLPSYTSVDVGFSYSQNGGVSSALSTTTINNVGGTLYTLSPGIYLLSGHIQLNQSGSGSSTITSIVYGFSSSASSFTNSGTAITNFKITRDTGTRTTSFGNTETYPGLNTSQTLQVTANTDVYFLGQIYFSGTGSLVSSNSNWNFVRIA